MLAAVHQNQRAEYAIGVNDPTLVYGQMPLELGKIARSDLVGGIAEAQRA
jgi:hypothetical protein